MEALPARLAAILSQNSYLRVVFPYLAFIPQLSPVAISLHIHRTFEFTSSVTMAIFHCHKTSDYFYVSRL